jgi:hypothetical protein
VLYSDSNEQDLKLKLKAIFKPFLKISVNKSPFIIYSDELLTTTNTFNLINFNAYNNESLFETIEDSYENLKNFKYIYT